MKGENHYGSVPMLSSNNCCFVYSTNIFCDKYDSSQKTYCKRLKVLCPEHTKEPKVSRGVSVACGNHV